MNKEFLDAVVAIVTEGDAGPLAVDLMSRTFTKDAKSVALQILGDSAIAVSSGGVDLGIVTKETPGYRELFIAVKEVRQPEGGVDQLLVAAGPAPMSKVAFMQLFALEELVDIEDLQKGDPDASIAQNKAVRTAMTMLDAAQTVDLSRQAVVGFMAYLKTLDSPNRAGKKVLTAARATRILSGQEPA